MPKPLVSDALWELIEPLLPREPPKPKGGRPRLSDRAALTGILFVLRSGLPWEMLPLELGCGSGMTCWRRLHEWQAAGVWEQLHRVLLDRLRAADQLDWSRAVVDSASVRAVLGGRRRAPIPRTAVGVARNTTFSPTPRASRSRSRSPRRTGTT